MAVAITEITFEIIEGNLKPSGACRIYPKAINVHTIAGRSATIYGFSVFLKYALAAYKTIVATIN